MDGVDNRRGHAARHGKATAVGRRNVEVALVVVGQREVVDLLGLHHARHLLEGEHEVHLAPDGLAHGLELLGRAGPHEDDLSVGVLGANHARRERHGREGHRDAVSVLGELLLGHDRPRRAAGGAHEGELVGNLVQVVVCLLDGAEVGSERHLLDAREAQLVEGLAQLAHVALAAKLADERRRNGGDDLVASVDGLDDLEDLALVGNGAKRAVDEALSARDALLVVDLRAAVLVGADGLHAAGGGAGTLLVEDGVVRADLGALPTVDALLLVDVGLLVHKGDGALGADLAAGVRKAALAHVGHAVDVVLAGVAGELDDVDEGRLVVGLGLCRLGEAVGELLGTVNALQWETQREADALAHDGALEKDALAIGGNVAGNDLVRQLVELLRLVFPALVRNLRHLAEDIAPDLGQVGVHATHGVSHRRILSLLFCSTRRTANGVTPSPRRRPLHQQYRATVLALHGSKWCCKRAHSPSRATPSYARNLCGISVRRSTCAPVTGWSNSSSSACSMRPRASRAPP